MSVVQIEAERHSFNRTIVGYSDEAYYDFGLSFTHYLALAELKLLTDSLRWSEWPFTFITSISWDVFFTVGVIEFDSSSYNSVNLVDAVVALLVKPFKLTQRGVQRL